jgi:hypothetical protein
MIEGLAIFHPASDTFSKGTAGFRITPLASEMHTASSSYEIKY